MNQGVRQNDQALYQTVTKRSLIRCLLLLCVLQTTGVQAARYSVLVYHGANPPYNYLKEGEQAGIFKDIFARLGELTGHEFEFVPLSVARGHKSFEAGEIDIEPGVNPSWRQSSRVPGIYSIDYAFSREVVLGRKEARAYEQPESFYGKVMGRVRGYRYGPFERHFGAGKIAVYDNISERELLVQLAHTRLDYIMIGDITAAYYIATNPAYRGFKEVYEISKLPVSMRIQPKNTMLKQELDQALSQMMAQGEITQIYLKYGIKM
ncbi:transporter substrate-binding domain-containing protein [Pseudoalteromonas sp. OOF1S-7]|uniref:substrate-binding periplasmic protein n=1 Tax=Pseudoalteromonas sp. OOF1S-7 TaxID=2917757 RepID=UPI001EF413AB|nr:transporter substrate-binding domain-containing protein [Pseudoalteromonas sp. OOF1S-7]MCG7536652.1 transporter substrate-binding domain-containing protein [Pseudoalteromonas sp. OOF1S-7]